VIEGSTPSRIRATTLVWLVEVAVTVTVAALVTAGGAV
jgi:hypothetical protein